MKVSDVMKSAIELGACGQSGKATEWKSLCWLFFTPQGREFCENNVFVDAGEIMLKNNSNVGIIGHTRATLEYDDNTSLHKVIAMHDAELTIQASNYAVINLTNVGNCKVTIINDGTARILC